MSIPNDDAPDDDVLAGYLLGTLPESEAERLDELSVTDESFAARLSAVEHDLIDAYVPGALSAETLDRFRSRCLSSPSMRKRVAFAEALAAYQARSAAVPMHTSFDRRPFPGAWRQWRLAAVAAVALVAGGYLLVDHARLRHQVTESQAARVALDERERQVQRELGERRSADVETARELTRIRESLAKLEARTAAKPPVNKPVAATFLLVPNRRGAGDITTIAVPRGADALTLRLPIEADDFRLYRATLKDPANNTSLWRSGILTPTTADGTKIVDLTVPAALMKPR